MQQWGCTVTWVAMVLIILYQSNVICKSVFNHAGGFALCMAMPVSKCFGQDSLTILKEDRLNIIMIIIVMIIIFYSWTKYILL